MSARDIIVAEIKRHRCQEGYGPTHDELCSATGKTLATVNGHLRRLKRDGIVTWRKYAPRTLRIVDEGMEENP